MATSTKSKTLPKEPKISDLRAYEGTLYVKNLSPHAVSANAKDLQFGLEPRGNEGSIAILPRLALDLPGFVKLWMKGALLISPDLEDEAVENAGRVDAGTQARLDEIAGMTEAPASDKDLIEMTCLLSGDRVYQTQKDIDNLVPPLSEQHKERAHEFMATQVQDESGKVVTKFNRVQIGK